MDPSIAEWLRTVTGADDEQCSVRYPNPALFQKLDEERPPELEALSFMQMIAGGNDRFGVNRG